MLVQTNKIALDENIDDYEGKTAEEVAEEIKKRDMAEQAQILEMVGDLRHADEAPPDNVLFVCKLNPVTTDEDLEIIFSRFGKIIKCEPKSCEQAFFKMDNVLIDDRRIHVDFSQSVAKLHQGYKEGKAQRYNAEEEEGEDRKPRRPHVKRDPSPRRNGNEGRHTEKHRNIKRSPERKKETVPEKKRRERSRSRDDLPQRYRRERSPEKTSGRRSRSKERAPRSKADRSRSREKLRARENRDRHDSREKQRENKRRERSNSRERRGRRSQSRSPSPEKSRNRERSRSPGRKKHRK
ncbi:hypothetical protein TELCIR_07421 [Teladorsagia circumcincta]|uniref:Uncharacterized protein n=1 Tax=Teladorsagia circumcincta TaxID=45464 RepID=A0A2G9UKE6_TELCI|nr:hypothetical protein TELCIR_07421 [Teladorsagia circumcincta]